MEDGKPIKIIFNPPENPENQYIRILVNALENNGFELEKLDDFFRNWKHFGSIQLVHLNWFENLDDTGNLKMWKSYFRKLIVLAAIRFGNKKLVWTMHNKLSHEKKSGKLSQKLTKKLVEQADAIIIHSKISESILRSSYPESSARIEYIPHPDFIDVYPASENNPNGKFNDKLQLLFVGAVKPYKNIELLVEVVSHYPEEVSLRIAGNPNSAAYKAELERLAVGKQNIHFQLEFIPDTELPRLIQQSDLLILPYSLESSLNSGTVILAFSYQRTVICPRIGTIDDLEGGSPNIFSYSYATAEEHLEALDKEIKKAITLKKKDPKSLQEKGKQMYELVNRANNKEMAGKKLVRLYCQLLHPSKTF